MYDPNFRTHLSYVSLRRYLSDNMRRQTAHQQDEDLTISDLFHALANRDVTGNAAKDRVLAFLRSNKIIDEEDTPSPELETFGRLLDRNLVAGFGAKTLSAVQWDRRVARKASKLGTGPNPPRGRKGPELTARSDISAVAKTSTRSRNLKTFSVALGKSIEAPFRDIDRSDVPWYVSRKLDGVRVVTLLDFLVAPAGVEIVKVEFRSRTGKPFTSLGVVEERLQQLVHFPKLREWLERDAESVSEDRDEKIKRLVLDGEICVMREKQDGRPSTLRPDDGTGAGAIWTDDNLEEDFTSTVSEIRRGPPFTIAHPVYFIFDIIDSTSFGSGSGPSVFSHRVQDMEELGEWLASLPEKEKVLRPLAQWKVTDLKDIEGMVQRAAEEGWEGLVFRADKPYKGKRS